MKKAIALEAICFLLIVLFLYASISKYVDYKKFVYDMFNQPFPDWFARILVLTLPPIEIIIAICLVINKTRLSALYSSLSIMTLFTIYTAVVLLKGFTRIPCSCGGIIKHLTWSQHLVFNLFFVGISIYGIRLYKKSKQPSISLA